ncbi:tyrosine-protein kinase SYK [Exaiptasia diaphana]|uniref:Tyrosine-protein kinase n=1 Tax=Exaiptasia diaphana TaxID=2652724 RepID=A0A913Y2E3_EXADI|nr:tyrosine-protein kinase SYK [Exaiptasia diaphana]
MQRQMESFIGKVLHQSELWFHGNISREEAERRLQRCGCTNGLFLIREKKAMGTFAMGLCYNGSVVHYLFDVDATGQLSIQTGPKFENLMLAIDHYTFYNDGLLYNLKEPCDASLFESRPCQEFQSPGRPASRSFGENDTTPRSPNHLQLLPNEPAGAGSASNFETLFDSVKLKKSSGYMNQFKSVQNQSFNLNSDSLSLGQELGHGNFGSVLKGTYQMPNGEKIPVAVKRLKSEELNNPKLEMMIEANIMMKLNHPYIVRIIGMCTAPTMMLVMELAAEGPLNEYLKNNKQMEMLNILIVMLQVAESTLT